MTLKLNTGNDVYSGDRFWGNDRFRGPKLPADAILFTISGITFKADSLEILTKNWHFWCQLTSLLNDAELS